MNLLTPLAAAASRSDRRALLTAAERMTAAILRGPLIPNFVARTMTDAFGGSDAAGAWSWRQAYDACEAAAAIAFRRGAAGETRRDPDALLALADEIAARLPLQSKRSETQNRLGQFSTPLPLAVVAAVAARPEAGELALEPSCGTGLLAAALRVAGCRLVLNEIDEDRAALAGAALGVHVHRVDAEFVDDLLPASLRPTLVATNPPFSSSAARTGDPGMAGAHLVAALKRLAPSGRLAAIMPEGFRADGAGRVAWAEACARATLRARIGLPAGAFMRQGVRVATALVVFDKASLADAPLRADAGDLHEALTLAREVGERPTAGEMADGPAEAAPARRGRSRTRAAAPQAPASPPIATRREPGQPLAYAPASQSPSVEADGLYAPYRVARIAIEGACGHPTPLVESAVMAAIAPPLPTARPLVPPSLVRRGVLSDAQLETLVYAAEAFAGDLPGTVAIDGEWRSCAPCAEDDARAVRLRRGFFLGDGTGCGKGRQVAGIILDQWLRGRRRALWVSKSDKLIEDARRDWTALGGDAADIRPLAKVRLGAPIPFAEGVLFVTYATLRVGPRQGKDGRLEQVVAWLAADPAGSEEGGAGQGGRAGQGGFAGVVAFDEAHAMGGAGGTKSDRGAVKGSQQGVAGLRLQLALPRARVLYVSATGATTVENLAYASRLGLWGAAAESPFPTREAFVKAMHEGGVAAMEVVARELKALGLYVARALSFAGVEVEVLEHALTPAQVGVYDAYAEAFQIIHRNLDHALRMTNVVGETGCDDAQAKAAARSRFESLKQRFFNHLLTGMKTPATLDAAAARLAEGFSVVIQLVSTGEALMDRRLDAMSEAERADLAIDLTPREAVVDYLREGFPIELRRVCEDGEGGTWTEIVRDEDGRVVESREACALRDAMIEDLCLLPPVQTALDQILWRFGADAVAEATGRTRRIVRVAGPDGAMRLKLERRSATANTAETRDFMGGRKRILVFSEAGGTGRSYHADRGAANRARRVHFLLEAGWRADVAIQGLGRTHRSNQASAPVFIPVTTDVSGERRFISTISRRLDSLGALTRGAAKTGGQGLFRPEDNLESRYARSALHAFYAAIASGAARSITLDAFTERTGLEIVAEDGALLDELPPITRFLNRILALRIAEQNAIFEEFGEIVAGRVAAAQAAGTFEAGLETLVADSVEVADRRVIRACAATGAETIAWRLALRAAVPRPSVEDVLDGHPEAVLRRNARSGHVAFLTSYASHYDDDGAVEPQVRLIRPRGREILRRSDPALEAWEPVDAAGFRAAWDAALAALPEFESREVTMVSGLILPIWRHLPADQPRIRRVRTDCGLDLVGRLVAPEALAALDAALGARAAIDATDPAAVARAVMIEGRAIALLHGVTLRRRRVGEAWRCELEEVPPDWVRDLKAAGCFVEIIQYRARVFAPLTEALAERQVAILARVLEMLPPVDA